MVFVPSTITNGFAWIFKYNNTFAYTCAVKLSLHLTTELLKHIHANTQNVDAQLDLRLVLHQPISMENPRWQWL